MKNLKKLIVIVTMAALLICAAMLSSAMADERIYTSPTFKLPKDKIMEWVETQPEEETPEGDKPADEASEEEVPEWENPDFEPRDEDTDDRTPVEANESGTPTEQTNGEAGIPERTVTIRSSQGDVVTEGEIIYLTSKLKGFDGLDIAYQWQVDRGDGAGWVDVEGANRSKHMFVADKDTIRYSWRLIVSVIQ